MNHPGAFPFALETPSPFTAPGGRFVLRGWCASSDTSPPPEVRLVGDGAGATVTRLARPDVQAALHLPPNPHPCGFEIVASLPPGAHLARLEARAGAGAWVCLRRFTVVASTPGLEGALEYPPAGTITESVRLQGWCAHPVVPLAELALHYGNRRVACTYGLPRTDVPALLPGAPSAAHAGFIAAKNIPVGHGPLRLCARDSAGRRRFWRADRLVDIRVDEENPSPLDLSSPAPRLGPRIPAAPATSPRRTKRPLRILFVLYGDLTSNSALHVAALADAFSARGHECVVAVPRDADTLRYHRHPRFRCLTYGETGERAAVFSAGAGPDIIHAWTTSERVRRFAFAVRAATAARLVVHLEDHEESILAASAGRSITELRALPASALDALVGDDHSHPLRRTAFLAAADGCTLILDRLAELVPAGKASCVFWPAATPAFFPRPIPRPFREALGWGRTHTVLFYHGNLHATNRAEMAELYEAVVALNASGVPTTLLRAGRDFCALPGNLGERSAPHVVGLGRVDDHDHLAPLLALADCFVQPGEPDSFNNYRFPSKLPEFFASGRPVILPRTNLGAVLRHRRDAYVLARADASAIAAAIREVRADPALAAVLATGAAAFAKEHFNWASSAESLAAFYETLPTSAV